MRFLERLGIDVRRRPSGALEVSRVRTEPRKFEYEVIDDRADSVVIVLPNGMRHRVYKRPLFDDADQP